MPEMRTPFILLVIFGELRVIIWPRTFSYGSSDFSPSFGRDLRTRAWHVERPGETGRPRELEFHGHGEFRRAGRRTLQLHGVTPPICELSNSRRPARPHQAIERISLSLRIVLALKTLD